MSSTPSRHAVKVGHVLVGGRAPVVIQSMTDTDTADVEKTVQQVKLLADAGSELVRVTVNTEAAAQAVPMIRAQLDDLGCPVPLVGDFHYNGHTLLQKYEACAKALAKYRINPGNVGFGNKKDAQFNAMIDVAKAYDRPVRIGVNWGSLDKALLTRLMDENQRALQPKSAKAVMCEAMIQSVLLSAQAAVDHGLPENRIIVSCKVSNVPDLIAIHRDLAKRCSYAIHLGLTEAGMGPKGMISSSVALGVLLHEGIGNTIRVSLTPEPGALRDKEVQVCQHIVQSLGLRCFTPEVSACPGCGRTTSEFFRVLAQEVESFLKSNMNTWRKSYPGVEALKVAVMGCVVNGPGESKHANIGISLPGTGEVPVAPVFIDGKKVATLRGDGIVEEFKAMIVNYIKVTYLAHECV